MSTLTDAIKTFDIDAAKTRYDDICSQTWTISRMMAETAFHRYCQNIHQSLYLYHTPSNGPIVGKLCVANELPGDGWKASDHRRIPRNLTQDQLTNWLHEIIARLPILVGDENGGVV